LGYPYVPPSSLLYTKISGIACYAGHLSQSGMSCRMSNMLHGLHHCGLCAVPLQQDGMPLGSLQSNVDIWQPHRVVRTQNWKPVHTEATGWSIGFAP